MNSESEEIKIEYGKWYWDTAMDRPAFVLYPYGSDYIACFCPVIRFDKPIYLGWEPVKRENIAEVTVNPIELDF